MAQLTLEKILQSQGFGSRKLCRQLVEAGRVEVNGMPCEDAGQSFATDGLSFTVDGENWRYEEKLYLAMNKPPGVECSHQPQHHVSVFSLLPPQFVARGIQCVGRLDADTTGLLLMSDDGAFIHTYSAPKKKVPKVYEVTVKHAVESMLVERLVSGVQLRDEPAPIAALACQAVGPNVIHLTIAEGKYHQVKRMVAAAGNRVEGLHRIAIGGFSLPPQLESGQYKRLDESERVSLARSS